MPKVNFKSYKTKAQSLPSELEIIVATYGPYLDVNALMSCLHRHRDFVYQILKSGQLPSKKIGRDGYLVSAVDLVTYINE
jgi:hypothetical protein